MSLSKYLNVNERNIEQLISLSETVSILVATYESLEQEHELMATSYVREVVAGLPPTLKILKNVDLESVQKWLEKQARVQ